MMAHDDNVKNVTVGLHIVGTDPVVWRHLWMPAERTLAELHFIIQAAFSWCDRRNHCFQIGGLVFGDRSRLGLSRVHDAAEIQLGDFAKEPPRFSYFYGFGAHWNVEVDLCPSLMYGDPGVARCKSGKNSAPTEDITNPYMLDDAIRRTKSDEFEEGDLDDLSGVEGWHPFYFNLTQVDGDVQGALSWAAELGPNASYRHIW